MDDSLSDPQQSEKDAIRERGECTPGEWRTEAVSDAVRIVVGTSRQKIVLARLNPPQLPERETHANARVMAAAKDLVEACKYVVEWFDEWSVEIGAAEETLLDSVKAAITKAEGK